MNSFASTVLQAYYAREREVLTTEPAVRAELQSIGVLAVHADYDGVGDSGQIEKLEFRSRSDADRLIAVDDALSNRVEALLYALLELRHAGWENNDGAFGRFNWNVVDGSISHEHHQRYTDHETSLYSGFGLGGGDAP